MSESYIHWPGDVLTPAEVIPRQVAFTRGGGRSLGGVERPVRTDRGFWNITLDQVPVYSPAQHRVWNAIDTQLGGRAGLIAVPAWSFKSAPYASGNYEGTMLTTHDDGTSFDDSSLYSQGSIAVEMVAFAPLGSTVVTLRSVHASGVSGIRFSYQHALYKTGPIIGQSSAETFQVPIFPAIRMAIPAGAELEVDEPTCLCRLKEDAGMDISEGITALLRKSVEFVEAVEFWIDVAIEGA